MKNRVVITGLGSITSLGSSLGETWQNIINNKSGISEITGFDHSALTCHIGGEIKSLKKTSNRHNLLLEIATKEAILSSNLSTKKTIGLYLGSLQGNLDSFNKIHLNQSSKSNISNISTHHGTNFLANKFKITGPKFTFTTACSASTNAIGFAFSEIANKKIDIAICGGADTLSPISFAGFEALRSLDPIACRPFDKNRKGLVLGEGAGILILESEKHALKRGATIFAEIFGYGSSLDGYHQTSPNPDGSGAVLSMQRALATNNINPEEIDYINAHGTGTIANDLMEGTAINKLFGLHKNNLYISSTKSQIGHTLGGAGAIEAIITTMAIKQQTIPPNLNLTKIDPLLNFYNIPATAKPHKITKAISNSFAFGGHMASLIIGEYRD